MTEHQTLTPEQLYAAFALFERGNNVAGAGQFPVKISGGQIDISVREGYTGFSDSSGVWFDIAYRNLIYSSGMNDLDDAVNTVVTQYNPTIPTNIQNVYNGKYSLLEALIVRLEIANALVKEYQLAYDYLSSIDGDLSEATELAKQAVLNQYNFTDAGYVKEAIILDESLSPNATPPILDDIADFLQGLNSDLDNMDGLRGLGDVKLNTEASINGGWPDDNNIANDNENKFDYVRVA